MASRVDRRGERGARRRGARPAPFPSLRLRIFEAWLASPHTLRQMVYHRGHLAFDRKDDPELAGLADRVLELSDGEFDLVSKCGHVRGHLSGSRTLRLFTRRERDEIVYLCEKREREREQEGD
jgi:hypothetical protein